MFDETSALTNPLHSNRTRLAIFARIPFHERNGYEPMKGVMVFHLVSLSVVQCFFWTSLIKIMLLMARSMQIGIHIQSATMQAT